MQLKIYCPFIKYFFGETIAGSSDLGLVLKLKPYFSILNVYGYPIHIVLWLVNGQSLSNPSLAQPQTSFILDVQT